MYRWIWPPKYSRKCPRRPLDAQNDRSSLREQRSRPQNWHHRILKWLPTSNCCRIEIWDLRYDLNLCVFQIQEIQKTTGSSRPFFPMGSHLTQCWTGRSGTSTKPRLRSYRNCLEQARINQPTARQASSPQQQKGLVAGTKLSSIYAYTCKQWYK